MQEPVHQETIKGFKIEIHHDSDPESPREWDNLGTIIYSSNRYTLGDVNCNIDDHLYGLCTDIHPDFPEEQFEEHGWKILEKYYHIIPVYAYIHSGVTISTGSFSCPWDSGQSGFIYCLKETMRKEIGNYSEERGDEALRQEIKTYDDYLTGQVYGYVITNEEDDDEVDSCWGFFGDYESDHCLGEARRIAEEAAKEKEILEIKYAKEKENLEYQTALAEVYP
jgi:hypothetical protein